MIPHGTLSGYTHHRCRCERCRAANAAYHRAYRARRRPAHSRRAALAAPPLTKAQKAYVAAFEEWMHSCNDLALELKDLALIDVLDEAGLIPGRRADITGTPAPAGVHAQQPWQVLGPPRHWR